MKLHPALATTWKSSRKGAWLLSLAAALALSAAMPATTRAAVILTVQTVQSTAGAFDVFLTNTGPSAVKIDAFAFEISVNNAQINMTQANISTTVVPYIFDSQSLFGPIISTSTGQTLDASDAYAISGSDVSIPAIGMVGLGHVLFSITGTLTSPATVTINSNPLITNLADKGNPVTIDSFVAGTIIPPTTGVPELSTTVLVSLMAGASGVVCLGRRLRRKSV